MTGFQAALAAYFACYSPRQRNRIDVAAVIGFGRDAWRGDS